MSVFPEVDVDVVVLVVVVAGRAGIGEDTGNDTGGCVLHATPATRNVRNE